MKISAPYIWIMVLLLAVGWWFWRKSKVVPVVSGNSAERIPESLPKDFLLPDTGYMALSHLLQLDAK